MSEMESKKPLATPSALDQGRLLTIIRIQGVFNILLLVACVSMWVWTSRIPKVPTIEGILSGLKPEIRIAMPIIAYGDNRQLATQDIVHHPEITLYGQVKNIDTLRDRLQNFTILLQGTTVIPKRETGEFAERLILQPGQNIVDIVLKWDGQEQKRLQYELSYIPETPTSTNSSTPL